MIRVFLLVIIHLVSEYTHLTQCPRLLEQFGRDSHIKALQNKSVGKLLFPLVNLEYTSKPQYYSPSFLHSIKVSLIKVNFNKMLFILVIILSACSEESDVEQLSVDGDNNPSTDGGTPPVVISDYPWTSSDGGDFLSVNSIDYKTNDSLKIIDVTVLQTENFVKLNSNGKQVYRFDDIDIIDLGSNQFEVINNTPDRINKMLVKTNEHDNPVLVSMDVTLQPFSKSEILFSENITGVSFYNTLGMFLPQITLAGEMSSEEGKLCSTPCYSDPDAQQSSVYWVLSSNLHKAFNHKALLPELLRYYRERGCTDYPSACASNGESVANINYMKMGGKGHRLTLKTLSGPYSNEGVGGGGTPNLDDIQTNSSGWASIWTDYITAGAASFRPFDLKTQKTLFHESAHGYGYNHYSGMTYGFADYYGKEFLSTYFDDKDITGVSYLNPASIVPVLVESQNNHLKYKIFTLEENYDYTRVFSRVITEEKISRKDRFFVENGSLYYELNLNEYPTSSVVIQFYDDSSNFVFSTREISQFHQPKPIVVDGVNLNYYELSNKVTQGRNFIHVNSICRKYIPGSIGATKNNYSDLWNSNNFDASLLNFTYYISSNMSQTNKRWKINMKDTLTLNMTSEDRYTPFGMEDSLLCIN